MEMEESAQFYRCRPSLASFVVKPRYSARWVGVVKRESDGGIPPGRFAPADGVVGHLLRRATGLGRQLRQPEIWLAVALLFPTTSAGAVATRWSVGRGSTCFTPLSPSPVLPPVSLSAAEGGMGSVFVIAGVLRRRWAR